MFIWVCLQCVHGVKNWQKSITTLYPTKLFLSFSKDNPSKICIKFEVISETVFPTRKAYRGGIFSFRIFFLITFLNFRRFVIVSVSVLTLYPCVYPSVFYESRELPYFTRARGVLLVYRLVYLKVFYWCFTWLYPQVF